MVFEMLAMAEPFAIALAFVGGFVVAVIVGSLDAIAQIIGRGIRGG